PGSAYQRKAGSSGTTVSEAATNAVVASSRAANKSELTVRRDMTIAPFGGASQRYPAQLAGIVVLIPAALIFLLILKFNKYEGRRCGRNGAREGVSVAGKAIAGQSGTDQHVMS